MLYLIDAYSIFNIISVADAPSPPTLVTSIDDLQAGSKVEVKCSTSDGRPLPKLKLTRSDEQPVAAEPVVSDGFVFRPIAIVMASGSLVAMI